MKKLLLGLFIREMKPLGVAWFVIATVQLLRKLGGTHEHRIVRREIRPGEKLIIAQEPRRRA